MKFRNLILVVAIVAGCGFALTGRAAAAKSCAVDMPATVAFGSYDVYGAALQPTATITVTCSGGGSPKPKASFSPGYGTVADRQMTCVSGACSTGGFSGDILHYNLYTDAGLTTPWSTISALASTPTNCKNNTCSWTVYGNIPAAISGGINDVSVGNYSDTITITVTY